jgi:hypothetical protein
MSIDFDSRKGNFVVGAMLVLAGGAILLDRTGALQLPAGLSLWPLILGGIGLARFLGTPEGEPKQGLLFMAGAAWLALGEVGWLSMEDSWPIAVIALGLIIALNGGARRWQGIPASAAEPPPVPGAPAPPFGRHGKRRHHRSLSGMAVIGIWIAIFVAFQSSGGRSFNRFVSEEGSSDRVRVFSVFGRAEHVSENVPFKGADLTNVFGRSEIDLRSATLPPGQTSGIRLVSMFGAVTVRVPPNWSVDSGAVSAFGGVRDVRMRSRDTDTETDTAAGAVTGPAPRLVLRGLVAFGRLTITS